MQETFGHYQKSSGYGNEAKAAAALERWGPNRFEVPLPQFGELLKEQLVAPFFVFQVFCVGLWCLDDYWCALLALSEMSLDMKPCSHFFKALHLMLQTQSILCPIQKTF